MRCEQNNRRRKGKLPRNSPEHTLTSMRVLDLRCLPGGKLEVIAAETGKPVVIRQDQVKAQQGRVIFIQRWLDRRIFGQHRARCRQGNRGYHAERSAAPVQDLAGAADPREEIEHARF